MSYLRSQLPASQVAIATFIAFAMIIGGLAVILYGDSGVFVSLLSVIIGVVIICALWAPKPLAYLLIIIVFIFFEIRWILKLQDDKPIFKAPK